eukprot:COSAG02_NODE_346_length_24113_cov_13.213001_2_plen_108_part_00
MSSPCPPLCAATAVLCSPAFCAPPTTDSITSTYQLNKFINHGDYTLYVIIPYKSTATETATNGAIGPQGGAIGPQGGANRWTVAPIGARRWRQSARVIKSSVTNSAP